MIRRLTDLALVVALAFCLSASGMVDFVLVPAFAQTAAPRTVGGGSGGGSVTLVSGTTTCTGSAVNRMLFMDTTFVNCADGPTFAKATGTLTATIFLAGDGSTTQPSFGNASGTGGMWFSGANSGPQFNYSANGFACGINNGIITGAFGCRGSGAIGFANNDTSGGTLDTIFVRHSTGVMRLGSSASNIRYLMGGGTAVASAAALPLPTGSVFHVTGTTSITSFTATNLASGVEISMIFDGILTVTNGGNIILDSVKGNFVTTANSLLKVVYDGTNFYEVARKQ